ncbi:hypothetical protein AT4G09585 [Arabidopsis thaliana]|uniref:Uncharacterized protein n=1 Tax=Arabidopsis thaliana TaxID=3702 RepID=A0A1P8B3B5_ARATH|nr:uncharacterized protein AT4G09585 [Arabidopsis thaliana]ANM66072.1 hypothetical protein AT4G09585 [Arabidopsis thaliana]|eukprot:NP_001327994.1 hypothetical protein AT4G09585 [Arabidopsis thaliana]
MAGPLESLSHMFPFTATDSATIEEIFTVRLTYSKSKAKCMYLYNANNGIDIEKPHPLDVKN